jgi:N-methylhydantoinase A
MSVRVGVDTGGTFTDLVFVDEHTGERGTAKVPSTPDDPARAVFAALDQAGCAVAEIACFVLGTTIATNCLLERKGQRTLYLTTAGFEDVPFIQRIDRKSLFDLQWQKSVPYVRRSDCLGVIERIAQDGAVRIELEDSEIERLVSVVCARDAVDGGVAVAINLLFAYIRPEHEQRLAAALRTALPGVAVSCSHEVAPIWREYERGNTVIVDAYLRRLTGRFAERLDEGLTEVGLRCPRFLLKSNGGQIPVAQASRQAVGFVISGLAGGLIAGRHFAEASGCPDVITLDMGGTSADVGVVVDGAIRTATQFELEWGLPIAVPVVDLTTIGAGGSSVAGFDPGGLLEVGPTSMGADPGPAAYGKGGTAATVTDANLVLGRLNPDYFLGGAVPLDAELARRAVGRIAAQLGCEVETAAHAIVDVACQNMANAVRLLCADRGLDYRRFDLMAFGGAGPLHAAALARRIGLERVLVPPSPGVASAFGAQAADRRVDRRLTRVLRSDIATDSELCGSVSRIATDALEELRAEGGDGANPTLVVTASARYLGQNFEQDVVVPLDAAGDLVEMLVERFHRQHEAVYGYRLADTVVELVHLNATAIDRRAPAPSSGLAPGGADPIGVRPVSFETGGWVETPIYRRAAVGAGSCISGPAVIEEVESTTIVFPGQVARTHASGAMFIESEGGGAEPAVQAQELSRA